MSNQPSAPQKAPELYSRVGELEGIAKMTQQALVDLRQDNREIRQYNRWIIGVQLTTFIAIMIAIYTKG